MADPINLRQARKNRARAEKRDQAEANRLTFGCTKAEKNRTAAEADLAARRLEGHRRDDDEKA